MTKTNSLISIIQLILIFIYQGYSKQVFIDYSSFGYQTVINKLFSDVYGQFYVDLGAYNPIIYSNTANFHARGWSGINVQANPNRAQRFYYTRFKANNINLALGNNNQIVTLYEQKDDSTATINPSLDDKEKAKSNQIQTIDISSINLKSLCQNYFYRRPLFMSVDVQKYEAVVLSQNDWDNYYCRPDLLVIQIPDQQYYTYKQNELRADKIMIENGYKRLPIILALDQVYAQKSVYEFYKKKWESFEDQKISIIRHIEYQNIIFDYFNLTKVGRHYQATEDVLYIHHCVAGESLVIEEINRFSNLILIQKLKQKLKDRVIIIYQFDIMKSEILIKEDKIVSKQIVDIDEQQYSKYWHYTMKKLINGVYQQYHVYIFDHNKYSERKQPKIVYSSLYPSNLQLIQNNSEQSTPYYKINPLSLHGNQFIYIQQEKQYQRHYPNLLKQSIIVFVFEIIFSILLPFSVVINIIVWLKSKKALQLVKSQITTEPQSHNSFSQ